LVGVDKGGFNALIVIFDTIVVIIAIVTVVIFVAVVGIIVGIVNLNNWLKLGCTPLIHVGYCYDAPRMLDMYAAATTMGAETTH
jgi:hypothetical protein